MGATSQRSRAVVGAAILAVLAAASSELTAGAPQEPRLLTGEVGKLQIDAKGNPMSGGWIEVEGTRVRVPGGLGIRLPGESTTLSAIFAAAPASCRARTESGLAKADGCRAEPGGQRPALDEIVDGTPRSPLDPSPDAHAPVALAMLAARRGVDGTLEAVELLLSKNIELVWGAVTFVNAAEGYLRINGPYRQDTGGMLLRLNDPDGRQSVQRGTACAGGRNCSPDARFAVLAAPASARFVSGNPACIPTEGNSSFCPEVHRDGNADGRRVVPVRVGDHLKAVGAFEIAGGVRFFSAQALVVETDLAASAAASR